MNNNEILDNEVLDNENETKENKRKKLSQKRLKRGQKLVIGIGLTAVVLVVATYAWFVGITTVEVSEFEVSIASSEGLSLSLDAKNWTSASNPVLNISKEIIEGTGLLVSGGTDKLSNTYNSNNNKNHWATAGDGDYKGLFPVSTNGEFCKANTSNCNSTLYSADENLIQFFDKTSMSSTIGGYKIAAAPSNDKSNYISFDLFIKNAGSGGTFTAQYNKDDAEALFITENSQVTYKSDGLDSSALKGSSIVDSLRIGFYLIGQSAIKGDGSFNATTAAQALMCSTTAAEGGICNSEDGNRTHTWNIWEPNDKSHSNRTINMTRSLCYKKVSSGAFEGASSEPPQYQRCQVVDGTYYHTFAVNKQISANDNANIYDGFNGYVNEESGLFKKMTTLRSSLNTKSNEDTREQLISISPVSITKVRVYIWLEGQDIDNFDLTSVYNNIKVKFGVTKDRYEESENNQGGQENNQGGQENNPSIEEENPENQGENENESQEGS